MTHQWLCLLNLLDCFLWLDAVKTTSAVAMTPTKDGGWVTQRSDNKRVAPVVALLFGYLLKDLPEPHYDDLNDLQTGMHPLSCSS